MAKRPECRAREDIERLLQAAGWSVQDYRAASIIQCSKHGTTVASIETNALLDFEIPLVAVDKQHRIAAEIETPFSRLDEAVANLERVKIS